MVRRKLQTELSLQQESEVVLRIQKGESQRKLAEQYGVSKTTVANIRENEHSIITYFFPIQVFRHTFKYCKGWEPLM